MAASLVPQTRNVSAVHLCHLCGTKTRTKLCEGCFNRYFCGGCYERYHTHPKRKGHTGWSCSFCTLSNPASTKICQACAKTDIRHLEKRKSSKKTEVPNEGHLVLKGVVNEGDSELQGWSCTFCTLINENTENICKVCAKTRAEEKNSLKRKHERETDDVYQKRIRRFQAENNIETRAEAEQRYKQTSSPNNNNTTNELCSEHPVHFGAAFKNDEIIGESGSNDISKMERKKLESETDKLSEDENLKPEVRDEPEMIKDELAANFVSAAKKDEIIGGESVGIGSKEMWIEMKNLEKKDVKSEVQSDVRVKLRDEPEVIENLENDREESEEIKDETEEVEDVSEVTEKMTNLTLSENESSELSREESKPLLPSRVILTSGAPNDGVSPITQNHWQTDQTREDKSSKSCKCCHIL